MLLLGAVEKKLQRIEARRDLLQFIHETFRLDWKDGWHEVLICDKLQDLESGKIKRLIIQMPPRHGKSEIGSRKFSAWCIGRNPDRPIILGTYAADLAFGFSRSAQGTVDSPTFRRIFPDVKLSQNHRAVQNWSVNESTEDVFIAAGVGGPITGKGGGILILDDPIKNAEQAESETYRENLWEWWRTTFRTRLEPGGSILIMLTRWHEDDLVGRLLALQDADVNADQWEVLNLPAIAIEDNEYRKKGEVLFPSRFSAEEIENIRASIGTRQFEALYQGNPTPPEGARFKRSWFSEILEERPKKNVWVRYWDWAVTPEAGDYTAGVLIGKDEKGKHCIADMVREQWEWAEAQEVIIQTAKADGKEVWVGIEEVAKDAAFLKELKWRLLNDGYLIYATHPTKKKEIRSMLWEVMAREGMIALVKGEWIPPFLHEVCSFPFGNHDDQVDSVGGGIELLQLREFDRPEPRPPEPKHIDSHRAFDDDVGQPKIHTDITKIMGII